MKTIEQLAAEATQQAAADKYGVTYQQVQRWIKYGCIELEGVVYKPLTKVVK
jgi:uncharacterized protein (DUF433 family)